MDTQTGHHMTAVKCQPGCGCARHRELADRAQFKGVEVSRRTLHQRVERRRGKAREYQCVRCPERALDWAQVHDTDGQDPWGHFMPLCRKCHRHYDEIGPRQRGLIKNPHHDALGRFASAATVGGYDGC